MSAQPVASYGTVRSVERVDRNPGIGAGAVIGGVLGGVAGHQIGDGSRQRASTAVGVIGGVIIGHQIDKQQPGAFQYAVQMDSGETRVFIFASDQDLKVGQRVRMADGLLQPN